MPNPMKATWDFLKRRKIDYQLAFTSPAGQGVLVDLAKFCRAHDDAWDADPRKSDLLAGRREVWLRIEKHLRLTPDQLYAIYAGHQFNPQVADQDKETEDE